MPRQYDLLQVGAFTTTPFAGNPCAVIPDAQGLDEATMQAIAREMNLSETAFVLPSAEADFKCRYFTPAEEVPLAGHPTIATVHALGELGRIPADAVAPVAVRLELAVALRVPSTSVRRDLPVQVVSTGTPQLMIPLESLTALRQARPDAARLGELRTKAGFFSVHAFTTETVEAGSSAHSRHWGFHESGLFEDPVTGSASGGMVCYLLHYGVLEPGTYRLEQGDQVQRPGRVQAEVGYDGEGRIAPPKIGGQAVTVMRGTIGA